MADNETDALLKDLEARAGSSAKAAPAASDDDEDIEAFLKSLEGEDYAPPAAEAKPATKSVKTKSADALDDKFAALEAAPDAPVAKVEKKKSRKEKRAEKKAEKEAAKKAEETDVVPADSDAAADAEDGGGIRTAARVAKWAVVLLPLATAWWVLGAFLSNWVSAGWLVSLLATVVVFGVPFAMLRGVKRGRYVWWTAGTSALIAGLLIAALPTPTADALARYGHWPTSTVADLLGLKTDSGIMNANSAIGGWFADWIDPQAAEDPNKRFPQKLGGDDPLNAEAPDPNAPKPDPTAPDPQPKPDPNAPDPNPQPDPNAQPPQPQPDPNAQPPQPQPDPNAPPPQPQPDPNAQPPQPQPNPNAQPPQPQPDPNAQPPQPQPDPNARPPQPQPDPNAQPPQPQPDPNAQPPQPDPNQPSDPSANGE